MENAYIQTENNESLSSDLEERFKEKLCLLKKWKMVEKEYYKEWVQNYENTYKTELMNHSIYFCSPPIHGKYDFSLNPADEDGTVCIVAKMIEGGWYGSDLPDEYYIVDNISEILTFVSSYMKQ